MSSSQKQKVVKSVLAESRGQKMKLCLLHLCQSRRELKIKTLGVIFRGASAYHVTKAIALQKQAVRRFSD